MREGDLPMLTPEQLIVLIKETSWGVPVRDMESLLAHGGQAVKSLVGFLEQQDLRDPEGVELLWPLVILGELGDPQGVPTLIRVLTEAPGLELPIAAAEGLSKCGQPGALAVERLLDEDSSVRTRILVYTALSQMDLPEAWEILEEVMEADDELDYAVARALAERNLPEDLRRVYQAYNGADPWKRSAFEETLVGMISGSLPWREDHRDWRLRYRRQPRQNLQIPITWPGVMLLMWESRRELGPSTETRPLSLDQLKERAKRRMEERRCEDCGRPLRSPTGVPLCEEVEEDLITFQLDRIRHWRTNGWEDVHEVLDELDHQEMEALQWPEENDEDRAAKGEALDAIEVVKCTLCWMVEQGLAEVSQGERRLEAALQRARTKRQ